MAFTTTPAGTGNRGLQDRNADAAAHEPELGLRDEDFIRLERPIAEPTGL